MIVGRRDGRLAVVRQVDHQEQCALIARAWGNGVFARPAHHDSLVTAAAVHDEGWRDWEERPFTDAAGAPIDFPDLPRGVHLTLYSAGIDAAVARDLRAGLVVCMHGRGLYEKRLGLDGDPPPREGRPGRERRFIAQEEARQALLEARIGGDAAAWAWAGFRLLQAWDVISLYLVWRGLAAGRPWTLPRVPRAVDDPGLTLTLTTVDDRTCAVDPWPFRADAVDLPVVTREIPDVPYTDASLRAALAGAPALPVPYRAVPAA
jgi:hypothetical protein